MARIDRHRQQPAHLEARRRGIVGRIVLAGLVLRQRRLRLRRLGRRRAGGRLRFGSGHRRIGGQGRRGRCLRLVLELAHQGGDRVLFAARRGAGHAVGALGRRRRREAALLVLGLAHQLPQRIGRIDRIQVEHQPVAVLADRPQREDLRRDVFLQVEHQPDHARPVLADADRLDIGIVGRNLGDQLAQRRRQVQAIDIDDQPIGIAHHRVDRGEALVRFDGHARIVLGRPDPYRDDAGAGRDLRTRQRQHDRSGAGFEALRQPFAAGEQQFVGAVGGEALDQHACSRRSPVGV